MSQNVVQRNIVAHIKEIIKRITKTLVTSDLARETSWMLMGQGLRIIIQALYFVVIARTLGVQGYGGFISTVTLVAILCPYSGLGSGNILIKNVARNNELSVFKTSYGNCVLLTVISGSALASFIMFFSTIILPKTIPIELICCVAISDLIFTRLLDVSVQAFQARNRNGWSAQLNVLLSFARMIGAVIMGAVVTNPTSLQWGYFYLFSTLLSSAIAVLAVCITLDVPKFTLRGLMKVSMEGFFFSVSLSAEVTYNDVDKTMLARFSSLEAAGIYSLAYRIIDVAFVPILSLIKTTYPAFFRHGAIGIVHTYKYAKRLLIYCSCYGALVGLFVFLTAPLLISIIGEQFEASVIVVRLLAILPLLKSVNYLMANVLTGVGRQKTRSMIQLLIVFLNIIINYLFISRWSWWGAAYSSIITNILLNCAFTAYILVLIKKEKRKQASSSLVISSPEQLYKLN